jgi:hypothetical protein
MGGQGPLQVPFKYWLAASLTHTDLVQFRPPPIEPDGKWRKKRPHLAGIKKKKDQKEKKSLSDRISLDSPGNGTGARLEATESAIAISVGVSCWAQFPLRGATHVDHELFTELECTDRASKEKGRGGGILSWPMGESFECHQWILADE